MFVWILLKNLNLSIQHEIFHFHHYIKFEDIWMANNHILHCFLWDDGLFTYHLRYNTTADVTLRFPIRKRPSDIKNKKGTDLMFCRKKWIGIIEPDLKFKFKSRILSTFEKKDSNRNPFSHYRAILYSARECWNGTASLVVRGEGNVTFPSSLATKLADDFGVLSLNVFGRFQFYQILLILVEKVTEKCSDV